MALGLPPLVVAFGTDPTTRGLLILIALDLVVAVAAAFRTGTFAPARLGDFYGKFVVPFLLGYAAWYFIVGLAGPDLPGWAQGALAQVAQWIGAGPGALALIGHITTNLAAFGPPPAPPPHGG